jgi:cytoskeletal protein CcmA (bactofilin family)
MWKARPDEKTSSQPNTPQPNTPPTQQPLPASATAPPSAAREARAPEPAKLNEISRGNVAAHIGKSVMIKGELSGSEDLYLDGEVEGAIGLHQHSLVIGPNARIRANISARELVVHGRVEGNITGAERVELKKSCTLNGDISTQRIVIEDGAFFKGSIDLHRDAKAEVRKTAAAAAGVQTVSRDDVNAGQQGSFLAQK